ncbi:MAG: hypothetical protein AMXMBFR84_21130 [Candidatus Hydrogenedentota bacterium]
MRNLLLAFFLMPAVLWAGADDFARVRRAVCQGVYYPPTPEALSAAVRQYLSEAEVIDLPGPVVGCIVPFASYPYSATVAAHAFKPLQKGQYKRVIVIAPSMYATYDNCSIPLVRYYQTLLGNIELDGPAVRDLIMSAYFEERSVIYNASVYRSVETQRVALHEREWASESILPFLQEQLGTFHLVPIVVGDVYKDGAIDMRRVDEIARELRTIMDESTLVVAACNFTQYGDIYNFAPFRENIKQKIGELDMAAFEYVTNRNPAGFVSYVDQSDNNFLGRAVVAIFLRAISPSARGVLLSYNTSANVSGKTDASTSYAAFAFFDPTRPMPAKPAATASGTKVEETAQDAPSNDSVGAQ